MATATNPASKRKLAIRLTAGPGCEMFDPPSVATISVMMVRTMPAAKPTPTAAGAVQGAQGGSSGRRAAGSARVCAARDSGGGISDCAGGGGTLGIGPPEVTQPKKISGRAQFHLSPPGAGQGSG